VRGQVPDGDLGEVVQADALILEVAAVLKRRPVSGQRLAEFLDPVVVEVVPGLVEVEVAVPRLSPAVR